jgi:peptide/nickel transport system substrate-binding protein
MDNARPHDPPRQVVSRRVFLTGSAALGTALASGCSSSSSSSSATGGGSAGQGQIAMATKMSELADLHPITAKGARGIAVVHHVCEGLTKFAPDFRVMPGLATEWKVSDDALSYTFTLRQGVTWHDGQPFSADDVLFTTDVVAGKDSKSPAKATFATYVESVSSPDKSTVVVKLKKPYAPLLAVMSSQVQILPKHLLAANPYQADFTAKPVGTGPYKVTARDTSKLTLERVDGYWGTKAKIGRIVMVDSPELAAQLAGLLSRELDVIEYDPNTMSDLKSRGGQIFTGAAGSVHGINLDLQQPVLQDKRVRQALWLALDRKRIRELDYRDGTPADALVSTAFTGFHASALERPFDPDAARKLLQEAGWTGSGTLSRDGQPLRFQFHTWPAKQWQDIAAIAQANWKAIGADVSIVSVENARIPEILSGRFDSAPLGWGLTASPLVGLNLLVHSSDSTFSKGGTFNVFRYKNPEVDARLEKALSAVDLPERQRLAIEVQQMVFEDAPFIPIAYPAYELASREGVRLDETGDGHLSGVGSAWFMDRWTMA